MLKFKVNSSFELLINIFDHIGFCSVIFGWDMHDKIYTEELEISNCDNGTNSKLFST
jgi:glutamine synthetase